MMLADMLEGIHSLAISGHIRPDGDCAGSTLGLYNYVCRNFPEIETDIFLDVPTDKLSFLAGFDRLNSNYDVEKQYDLMICLDCASRERLGRAEKYFAGAAHTVNIDHHVSNTLFADENYVDGNSSSACEMLYGFLDPAKLDRDIAICLYTGIIYDTGVFKYSSTSPATMRIAADLMEYGIPTDFVIDESFYAKTYDENRIFGYAVLNSKLAFDGKVIYSSISLQNLYEYGVSSKELEGIVAQLRLTKGVYCSVFLHEIAKGEYKVSLRSGAEVDVNKVAAVFDGGGHVRASGCNLTGTLEECEERLLAEIGKQLNEKE